MLLKSSDQQRRQEAETKVIELNTAKEQSRADKEKAEQAQKAAAKALREAEEKAQKDSAAEAQKKRAAEEQKYYDDKATKVWAKWAHAEEFRRLCLIPGNRHILPKARQIHFTIYLKGLIKGELTVEKIEQAFNREARDFVAGILRQKEAENPILKLQNLLKDWDRKMAAIIQ